MSSKRLNKTVIAYSILTLLVIGAGAFWGQQLFLQPAKADFLPGQTTSAHHQIELACGTCHQSPFGGGEVLQTACVGCHATELKSAHDSHPKSKFTDPRNADRIDVVDARYCASCHREHQPEITHPMAVTLPDDFCIGCHEDIAEERPSHEGMAFDTCASAGCHNYHDNRGLYEDFLVSHAGEPDVLAKPVIMAMRDFVLSHESDEPKTIPTPDYPVQSFASGQAVAEWARSAHAAADINCSGCHGKGSITEVHQTPDALVCVDCHKPQAQGFMRGKHGMRLAVHVNNAQSFPLQQNLKTLMEPEHRMLSPMTPAQSLGLAFKSDAMHDELTCNSCHQPHQYRLQQAGLESCMGCHDDEHTRNYLSSPHYGLVLRERAGELPPGSGVTCATCHMPKTEDEHETGKFFTQHNQNDNLRPNEKMIRTVCLDCHGAQFVLNALADPALIHSNFNGQPSVSIDSIEMSVKRERKE